MMDKLFGDKDPLLKSITKMNLLFDGSEDTLTEMETVLAKIKRMNYHEANCIQDELVLTYDQDGNIMYAVDIGVDECKDEIYDEPEGEQNSD